MSRRASRSWAIPRGRWSADVLESLSIVFFNDTATAEIYTTVCEAFAVAPAVALQFEVVVCDDGSSDATCAEARRHLQVRVLEHAVNRGIEASIRDLYRAAKYEWVFLISADRQWHCDALIPMAAAVEKGADFVLGVRENKREIYTPYRRALSWTYELVIRGLGSPVGDPGTIKLARRTLLDRPLVATGVFAEGERVVRSAREGARIAGVPVPFTRRTAGKATGARRAVVIRA